MIFSFTQPLWAFNPIILSLPSFNSTASSLELAFDIKLPPGQKLNLGAQSNLKIQEQNGSSWNDIGKIDLNQSVDFLGNIKRVTVFSKKSPEAKKIRVKGTLYHCPKKNIKGAKNYCVIQPIKGIKKWCF